MCTRVWIYAWYSTSFLNKVQISAAYLIDENGSYRLSEAVSCIVTWRELAKRLSRQSDRLVTVIVMNDVLLEDDCSWFIADWDDCQCSSAMADTWQIQRPSWTDTWLRTCICVKLNFIPRVNWVYGRMVNRITMVDSQVIYDDWLCILATVN